MSQKIFEKLAGYGVVPVIAIDSVDSALGLANVLIEGGLPVAEITFRTEAAADVISALNQQKPELIVGAGTVLTIENLQKAKDCGAAFAVAPGLNPEIVKKAIDIDLPFVPGVATPSDIEQAMALGCKILKFFPAEANGGVKMLNAMSAPYKHTGVRFIPTGGINMANLHDYLELPKVIACGGTWIAKKDDISNENWPQIKARCAEVAELMKKIVALFDSIDD